MQQILLGGVCVGGAFLMGHFLNNQTPPPAPFEKQTPLNLESGKTSLLEHQEMTAKLPNFRSQSTLGQEFDAVTELPPPSQLDEPAKDNLSTTMADPTDSIPEMDIEVPDFSALAAQFKGTALELPSLDAVPSPNLASNGLNSLGTTSKETSEVNPTVNPKNGNLQIGSGLASGSLANQRVAAPAEDVGLSIPNFKTSINPLEGLDAVNPDSATQTQPMVQSAETSFRAEDFIPRLRSDSQFVSSEDANRNLSTTQPVASKPSGEIQPPNSQADQGQFSQGHSVLELENGSARPSSPSSDERVESMPAMTYNRHPNAVISYNDPFPSTNEEKDNQLESPTATRPLQGSQSGQLAGGWRESGSSGNQADPSEAASNATYHGDSAVTQGLTSSGRQLPLGLNEAERNRLSRLNQTTPTLADVAATRFEDYQTRQGDTLQAISTRFYGTPDFFLDIYLANRKQLRNPAELPSGIVLRIPIYE